MEASSLPAPLSRSDKYFYANGDCYVKVSSSMPIFLRGIIIKIDFCESSGHSRRAHTPALSGSDLLCDTPLQQQ